MTRRVSREQIAVVTSSLVAVVVLIERYLRLRQGGPPGVDAGNLLGFGRGYLGDDLRPIEEIYPPIVPLLLTGFVSLLGLTNGVSAMAALASVTPAVGVLVALRRLGLNLETACWCAAPLLLAPAVSEPAAWGGFPQLIGLSLVPIGLGELVRMLAIGGVRSSVVVGVIALVIALTSHLVFVFFTVTCSGVILLSVVTGTIAWRKIRSIPLVLLVLLPAAPLYIKLANGVGTTFADRSEAERLPDSALIGVAAFVVRNNFVFWGIVLVIGMAGCLLLVARRQSGLWRIAVSVNVTAVTAWLLLREYRVAYFLPVAAIFGMALVFNELGVLSAMNPAPRWVIRVSLLLIIGQQGVAASLLIRDQVNRYRLMDHDLVSEMNYIRENTASRSVIGVPSCGGLPLGWWVEGAGARTTLTGSDLRWLNFADERRRAILIGNLISPPFPVENTFRADAGVSYVLLTKRCQPELFMLAVSSNEIGFPVVHRTNSTALLSVPEK